MRETKCSVLTKSQAYSFALAVCGHGAPADQVLRAAIVYCVAARVVEWPLSAAAPFLFADAILSETPPEVLAEGPDAVLSFALARIPDNRIPPGVVKVIPGRIRERIIARGKDPDAAESICCDGEDRAAVVALPDSSLEIIGREVAIPMVPGSGSEN